MIEDLKKIISMETVLCEGEDGTAFGKNIAQALEWFALRARELGLDSYYNDSYAYAETNSGDDNQIIGIAAHLDVVPVNAAEWDTPPFELVEKDGMFYGRGISDDKGPAIICLHVLAQLNKLNLKHKVRLIVGGDEETGSRCLKRYCKEQKMPICSLVPDADFPIINSEKGILHLTFTTALPASYGIIELSGGQRPNVVPDYCKLVLDAGGEAVLAVGYIDKAIVKRGLNKSDFIVTKTNDTVVIEAMGVAGHAAFPGAGDNAIAKIFKLLTPLIEFDRLDKYISGKNSRENLELMLNDETGELTMNLGMVSITDNMLECVMDFRLPICCNPDRVQEALFKRIRPEKIVINKHVPNLYVPADSKLVRTLLKCYSALTGDHTGAQITGGGTYARELKNAVAFGPVFPGTETNLHNANECIPVAHLEKLYEIYIKSIATLDKEL